MQDKNFYTTARNIMNLFFLVFRRNTLKVIYTEMIIMNEILNFYQFLERNLR